MPITVVVDASVVLKFYVPEQNSERAALLLESIEKGETLAVAPDLIFPEAGNVLWRKRRAAELTAADARTIADYLLALPFIIEPSRPIFPLALDLSLEFGITTYDALYLSLASVYDSSLITADRKLISALAKTGFKKHIAWLGNYETK